MKENHVHELLFQALETEKGGVRVYETALRCAVNHELKKEWQKYLEQTKQHVEILEKLIRAYGLDPATETPGRLIVRHIGEALVGAMEKALGSGVDRKSAQIVAAECVVLAETKDHLNWELIGLVTKKHPEKHDKELKAAYDKVEDEEDEHLYHTTGWTRELWIQELGLKAILPPPEEKRHVKTAIGAAKVIKERSKAAKL